MAQQGGALNTGVTAPVQAAPPEPVYAAAAEPAPVMAAVDTAALEPPDYPDESGEVPPDDSMA
jgi:hypothetical protein